MAVPRDRLDLHRPHTATGPLRALFEAIAVPLGFSLLGAMLAATTAVGGIGRLLLPPERRAEFMRRQASRMFRAYLRALQCCGLVRVDLAALDALRDEPGLLIAPNHPSLIDAPLMISRLPRSVCIMKSALDGNAFLGAGSRMCGYIRNDCAHAMVRRSVDALRRGGQLLIFPEGTRTQRDPIGPLTGAFALIARRAGAPIQTVIIEADSRFLSKGWSVLRRPAFPLHYRVRLGERLEASGSVDEIVARVTRSFERELARSRAEAEVAPASRSRGGS